MHTPFGYDPIQRRTRGDEALPLSGDGYAMENRFKEDSRLGTFVGCVSNLIEAVAKHDRWQIARNTTGPLLEQLLAGNHDHRFGSGEHAVSFRGLQGAPIVVADERVAIVLGTVPTDSASGTLPVTAVLVAGNFEPKRWLVAALDFDATVDVDFQRRVQFGAFSEDADLAVIAAHSPLDTEATAINWDDDTAVVRNGENGVITVADTVAELSKWDRTAWSWLAADRVTLLSLYLRAVYPELVREHSDR